MRIFRYYNQERDAEEEVNTLYGCHTQFCRCCGFCERHGKYLTVKQMKKKECLRKQCGYLAKIETHAFWEHRKTKLLEKKEKRSFAI